MSASEPKWSRLDNAAKIFPSTSSKKDPKVFRFSCELTEPVDGQTLQLIQSTAGHEESRGKPGGPPSKPKD